MSKKIIAMAMAFAALASTSEDRRFLDMHNSVPKSEPDWKRKKCKSCGSLKYCGVNPKRSACKQYKKRK